MSGGIVGNGATSMALYVFLNGEFLRESDARVSVYDGGWLHGAGLFETMRAENGRVLRLESHVTRLRESAARLLRPLERFELPSPANFLELLERNQLTHARVRLTVTAGPVPATAESDQPGLTVCVTAAPLAPPPLELFPKGVRVMICSFRQSATDPLAGHKTTAHLSRLLGLQEAQRAQCAEALWFTTRNHLAEGCITNVFLVRDGVLQTPPLDTPVLPGIARGMVLELARNMGMESRERTLAIDDLLDADEVFLTNVILQVMPVTGVEKRDIGNGHVGEMTRKLGDAYRDLVRTECNQT